MDYRNLLAFAAILLSGAVFVHSLSAANAFPQGPNVSMGSNPIENFYGSAGTVGSITFQQDFILTTFISNSSYCNPKIDGVIFHTGSSSNNLFFYRYDNPTNSVFTVGNATLKIQSGASLSLASCGDFFIAGYYVHS